MLTIRNHIKEHQRRNPISVLVLADVEMLLVLLLCFDETGK